MRGYGGTMLTTLSVQAVMTRGYDATGFFRYRWSQYGGTMLTTLSVQAVMTRGYNASSFVGNGGYSTRL